MNESIGKRILRLRLNKDMKQKELADTVGITEATLSRYENELRSPKGEIVLKLAKALGVSSDYLLGSEELNETDAGAKEEKSNSKSTKNDGVDTIAAHLEGKNLTPEKIKEITKYIDFLFHDDED